MTDIFSFLRAMLPIPTYFHPFSWGWLFNAIVIIVGWKYWKYCQKKYQETKSRQLLNSVPGIFTSLGILFTFISICVSLGGISDAPTVDNVGKTVAEAQSSDIDIIAIIRQLIPAFTTSIYGIIFALWSNNKSRVMYAEEDAAYDKQHHTPEENIEKISNAADAIFGSNKTIEGKLFMLEEILKHMKDQDALTKQYNEELNSNIKQQSSILEKFINDFVIKMDDIFTKMHDAVEEQITAFGKTQFEKTNQVMQKLANDLSEMSKSLVDKQSSSVNSIMADTNVQITKMTENLVALTQSIGQKNTAVLDELSKKQSEKLDVIIESYTQLSKDSISRYQKIGEDVQKLSEALAEQNKNSLTEMGRQQEEKLNAIITGYTQLGQDTIAKFQKIGDDVQKLSTALAEQNNTALTEMSKQQDEKLTAIINGYTQLNQSSLDSYKVMAENMKTMNKETTEQISRKLQETVTSISSSLSQQAIALGDAIAKNVSKLEETYKFIDKYVAQIKGDYEQATLAYSDAVQNAHDLNASFESTINQVNEGLKSVVSTNNKIDEVIKVVSNRQESIEAIVQKIKELSSTMETLQSLESTLNKLVVRK